jgi:nucleotide-binding universal stress UspA family protein
MKNSATDPFKTILVGVDFSEYSKLVVKQAQKLAEQFDSKLVIVHAASMISYAMTPDIYIPVEITKQDLKRLQTSLEKFYRLKSSDGIQFIVREGLPTEVLSIAARKAKLPLIVVGSQGKGAISRFILGSQAEKIALEAPCPVWVHRGDKIVPMHRVLVPTDLSSKARNLMNLFESWSENLGLEPKYVFVRPEILPLMDDASFSTLKSADARAEAERALQKFRLKGPDVPTETVAGGSPSARISDIGKKYDVIAMNPHSHPEGFHSFGQVTSKVIRSAKNPVLVVRT